MKSKCPSCGGTMKKEQQGDGVFDSPKQEWLECEKCGHTDSCGGSGEVDVVKAECEAVAAGYRKVSLREKKSVVGEEDDFDRAFKPLMNPNNECIALDDYSVLLSEVDGIVQEKYVSIEKVDARIQELEAEIHRWKDEARKVPLIDDESILIWARHIEQIHLRKAKVDVLCGLLEKKEVKKE